MRSTSWGSRAVRLAHQLPVRRGACGRGVRLRPERQRLERQRAAVQPGPAHGVQVGAPESERAHPRASRTTTAPARSGWTATGSRHFRARCRPPTPTYRREGLHVRHLGKVFKRANALQKILRAAYSCHHLAGRSHRQRHRGLGRGRVPRRRQLDRSRRGQRHQRLAQTQDAVIAMTLRHVRAVLCWLVLAWRSATAAASAQWSVSAGSAPPDSRAPRWSRPPVARSGPIDRRCSRLDSSRAGRRFGVRSAAALRVQQPRAGGERRRRGRQGRDRRLRGGARRCRSASRELGPEGAVRVYSGPMLEVWKLPDAGRSGGWASPPRWAWKCPSAGGGPGRPGSAAR